MVYIMGRVFAKTIEEAAQYVFDRLEREGLIGEPRIRPANVQPNPHLCWWEYGVLCHGT
ncbi:hypothetical protein [Anaerospora hongkongensis]|uniref:hypothetical protein n=1 Tax=Anaerospora hongkongensis TaxID=244830 RepID=UPI001404A3F3|nr:hypothetical protein [Anaerospora hongkongensis]